MFQLSKILPLFLLVQTIKNDETYTSSVGTCDTQCKCDQSSTLLTLTCHGEGLQHMLSMWPPHNTTIKAIFTGNNMSHLETLPPSDYEIEVILSNNRIQTLSTGLFSACPNVKLVDLSHNLLTSQELSSDKFMGSYNNTVFEPIKLENLDLSYNRIHSLAKNQFEHLPELTVLNLAGNDFVVLDMPTQLALSSIKNLLVLNLADNELTELIEGAISNDAKLIHIDLSSNELDFVPSSLKLVGGTLEVLIMDGNPIIEIENTTFTGLHNLVELSLNNLTNLHYITGGTFAPLPRLKKLSMCHNLMLKDIDSSAFAGQLIIELYLNNNRLRTLNYHLLDWSTLDVLDFRDNPLDCYCDLYNITKELSPRITRSKDGPYCIDLITGQAKQVFTLQSDICHEDHVKLLRPVTNSRAIHNNSLKVLRIPLLLLTVVLVIGAIVALGLGFTRYRKQQRNKNYPFASEVMYQTLASPRF